MAGAGLAIACLIGAVPRDRPPRVGEVRYQGSLDLEAHFRRPGDTRAYHSEQWFRGDGRGNVRLDWTTWEDGDTLRVPETYLLVGDRVFHRSDPGASWRWVVEGMNAAKLQTLAGLPWELRRRDLRRAGDRGPRIVSRGGRAMLFTDRYAHPRLGDVTDSIAWTYGADPVPESLRMTLHESGDQWVMRERRVAWSREPSAESLFAEPARFDSTQASSDSVHDTPMIPLAPGVWAADMEDMDSRSVIVEFADHLALIEMADDSRAGERLVDAVTRHWPGKPIREVFFSHYHPHYTGGLRAAIAAGATIVTTPGNEAFVRRLAALPFHLEPDRLARQPRALSVRTFTGREELADSTNRLVAIDYGARSEHTDEFVIFWLPRARLLFETELGWVKAGEGVRAGRRAKALLAYLASESLDVDRLVQSWPIRDLPASMARAELQKLVDSSGR